MEAQDGITIRIRKGVGRKFKETSGYVI